MRRIERTNVANVFARIVGATCIVLSACTTPPVKVPPPDPAAVEANLRDERGRFREILCAVLEARGAALPDYRPCDEVLRRIDVEPAGTGKPVDLGPSKRHLVAALVPGIGYECFEQWLESPGTAAAHVRQFGFDLQVMKVDALSGTATNARQIRDAIMASTETGPPRIVLIGYSKGAPDILDAVTTYPEIRGRVAAVVSLAGAVWGSALANDSKQYQADMLRYFPGATCESGDGGAVESLRPAIRQAWMAQHPLPRDVHYYSLATFPQEERISSILTGSYKKLAKLDPRNDSQMIFYDEIIPDSTLVGYLDADHWAIAVPVARSHPMIGSVFVTQNAYPREALLEALLRFLEEDLAKSQDPVAP
jgi:hypothetical protein